MYIHSFENAKSNDMKQKSIAAVTLGCKVNYAETSSIVDMLLGQGWTLKEIDDGAALIIINTCAVTAEAERKSRQQIRKIIRKNPGSRIVVTGCYAQLAPDRIASIDGVSLVLGLAEKFETAFYQSEIFSAEHAVKVNVSSVSEMRTAHVASSLLSRKDNGRTRAFLKIQDGCSCSCAYCTIPLARGQSRSVSFSSVIERATRIAEAGYSEIVLTGINLADYRDGDRGFADLLVRLAEVDVRRIRISSVEPQLLDDRLIDIVAGTGKIMPHFHLPLQSGSGRVLRAMGRQYDRAFYHERLLKAVTSIPGCAVGADVMVGYPGENEEDFNEMYAFIEALPVAYLHVFSCSVRPGTRLWDEIAKGRKTKVCSAEIASRAERLGRLADRIERRYAEAFVGLTLRVLFEERSEAGDGTVMWSGYSENYLRVQVPPDSTRGLDAMRGTVREVLVEGFGEGLQLQGRLLS